MKRAIVITILFISALNTMLFAQDSGVIEGSVTDLRTGKPIPNVNVYINGSTIGTSTNKDGNFELERIPSGVYEVIYASLGYTVVSREIALSRNQIARADVKLEPQTYSMGEVHVTSKVPKVWRRRLKKFENAFLGTSKFSAECTIENPEVLNFRIDKKTRALIASTDSTLIVVNKALGYRLYISLGMFRWERANGMYEIYPYFKEMKPSSPGELAEWKVNRKEAYDRSFRFFLYALVNHRAVNDGFKYDWGIKKLNQIENMYQLAKLGIYNVDLTGFKISTTVEVDYRNHKSSIIRRKANYFFVDPNGNLLDPLSISLSGAWSYNRVGSLLPFNYHPKD